MIITSLVGGLGNQLFQYAAGRALSHKHGSPLKLDTVSFEQSTFRLYYLDDFNICARKATRQDILRLDATEGLLRILKPVSPRAYAAFLNLARKSGSIRFNIRYYDQQPGSPPPPLQVKRIVSQRIFDFDKDFFLLPDNIVLLGSWISYKYFDHIRPVLLHELSVKHELQEKNKEAAERIQSAANSVSLHVRRTDKVNSLEYFSTDPAYISRAISFFRKNCESPLFFIFSDDIPWCKANITLQNAVFVDWNADATAYEDLRLMSLCKHNVIAESSFSWWGAYLNQNTHKIVVSPPAQRWVSRENSLCHDILPPEWIVIQ